MKSLFAITLFFLSVVTILAQTPPAGTVISNQATVLYSDPAGNNHTQTSNTVTATVAKVSGLAITPDAQTATNLVPGGNQVLIFTLTNSGNFADSFVFGPSGTSLRVTGSATLTRAVIDLDNDGVIDLTDTDISGNAAAVTSASVAAGGVLKVLAEVTVAGSATPGSSIQVQLGDAGGATPFDNQTANNSANEVQTADNTAVNGKSEGRGDYTFSVIRDAEITVSLAGSNGPVAPGDTITYTTSACNLRGAQNVAAISLNGSPASVYVIGLIPTNTSLKSGQTFPVGTLYSIDPHTVAPTAATWTSVQPALSSIKRIAFASGATLAPAACTTSYIYDVEVEPTITSTSTIVNIADAFGTNGAGNTITDQSGDNTPSQGSGNGGTVPVGGSAGTGIPLVTPVTITVAVLNGPDNAPDATGPTSDDDDYTNKAGNTGLAGVSAGGTTTAPNVVIFDNTVLNAGDANDNFVLTTPTIPSGVTVEISKDGGATWTAAPVVTGTLAPGDTFDYKVRVTIPTGAAAYSAFATVIRATSANDPTETNDTIDRVYTGFVVLSKSQSLVNGSGVGSTTTPAPGAVIEYKVDYTNIASTGGTGSITLNATNFVITEDGSANSNNWATWTNYQSGETDSLGATIVVGTSGSGVAQAKYTSTLPTLAAGASGTLTIKRIIK